MTAIANSTTTAHRNGQGSHKMHQRHVHRRGLAVVQGSSSRSGVLREARVHDAKAVVVATNADDAAVLTVLTARDLAPRAWIVAAVTFFVLLIPAGIRATPGILIVPLEVIVRYEAHLAGKKGEIFAHLPIDTEDKKASDTDR